MTTLLSPPQSTDLPDVSFLGRSLEEYCRSFALDPGRLRGRAVLDVAAGTSSFTAEACRRGIDAVAVDPLYLSSPAALAARIRDERERRPGQLPAKPPPPGLDSFSYSDDPDSDRRAAARRFLADYEANARRGRYVRGALTALPFLDEAFDLVLCAHRLFVGPARFDLAWHVAACRELVRVSTGEARIHPVCGSDGRPGPELNRLKRELRAVGIGARLVKVDDEFSPAGDSMLVLTRAATVLP